MRHPSTKAFRAISTVLSIAIILYAALSFLQGKPSSGAAASAPPPLTGEAAIARLKEQGLYSSLIEAARAAQDAARPLPAHFDPDAKVEDTEAASSPESALAIDLPFMQLFRQTAHDGAENDSYGWSVAASDNTVVVGAYLDTVGNNPSQGSAYVFSKSGDYLRLQQKLTVNDGEPADWFGYSVAISGDKIVVGAPNDKSGTNSYQGSAYVFTRSGGVWSFQQKLTAHDGEARDQFGYSVAISGDTIVAGAFSDDIGDKADQGSAYVFVRSNNVWSLQQKLMANDGAANDRFGYSVAISGNTIIAGAPHGDLNTELDIGLAYIFVRSGTSWTRQSKLFGPISNRGVVSLFGAAVAVSGDSALVGAPKFSPFGRFSQGMAVVYARSGGVWELQGRLEADDGEPEDEFGVSVAIAGNTALVGARFDDIGAIKDRGSAYLFTRSAAKWAQRQKFTAQGVATRELFGHAVALSGDRAIVGAPFAKVGDNLYQGAVYVFGCGYAGRQTLTGLGGGDGDQFGYAIAIDGDTAVVGAPTDDVGTDSNLGSAYVFKRSGSGWTQSAQLFPDDGRANQNFGHSVAISGDTIVVGSRSISNRGAAYIFVSSGGGWTLKARPFGDDGDFFGYSVAARGDRIVIGSPYDDVDGKVDQGSVTVYKRSGATWTQEIRGLTSNDGAASDNFGFSVAVHGDRLLVGAPVNNSDVDRSKGSAYVFESSPNQSPSWIQRAKLIAGDAQMRDHLGHSVALNGDTALASAPGKVNNTPLRRQAAYVFGASAGTWSQQSRLILGEGVDHFPVSVALIGNTAVIGTSGEIIDGQYARGAAHVFTRSGTVWTPQQHIFASDGQASDIFGVSVAIGGSEIMVGAFGAGSSNQGAVYVLKTNCAASLAPFACGSAASYDSSAGLAPESIVAGFGSNLATGVEAASSPPLPTTLAGVSVKITDSSAVERMAPLFFVSPGQINYLIPPGTANGPCAITVAGPAGEIASGVAQIAVVAPGLFSANSSGAGVANAFALRVKVDGSQFYEPVARFDPAQNRMIPVPLDLDPATDQVFLVLFGTGLRQRSSLSAVSCSIGGVSSEVIYVGPAPGFDGLDQVNVRLPRSLAGRGEVDLSLFVDGKAANTLRISIR